MKLKKLVSTPQKVCSWMGGWMDGWMDGWVDGWVNGWTGGLVGLKAILRIAYSNKKHFQPVKISNFDVIFHFGRFFVFFEFVVFLP